MKEKQSVIAVFDIGKTNKKLLVFDTSYQVLLEETTSFAEESDEDDFPCEDIDTLTAWILRHVQLLKRSKLFQLKAVNFSTYGASLLYIDAQGKRIAPLYNYLKPYPQDLLNQFYATHGDNEKIAVETSSPIMGHLNAGLQLYWLKHQKPALYKELAHVIHFPQYLSYQLTGKIVAEMTNVGCHSAMWNFKNGAYHQWLQDEGIQAKLSPVVQGNHAVFIDKDDSAGKIAVGIGLHDSSAAIIPYLISFKEPFIIVSTGTWTISLNLFNKALPQLQELNNGCPSYLTYEGDPVKISMNFAGHDHDQQANRIAAHFNVQPDYFKTISYDQQLIRLINSSKEEESIINRKIHFNSPTEPCVFHLRHLAEFQSADHAYHQLVTDIINRQAIVTQMIMNNSSVKNIYVEGGFCKNNIYMQLLSDAFPGMDVYASSMIQGTALGAALAIHDEWNSNALPASLINLKHWPKSVDSVIHSH
jgi:sugar (pentulose or hexulose) kinase